MHRLQLATLLMAAVLTVRASLAQDLPSEWTHRLPELADLSPQGPAARGFVLGNGQCWAIAASDSGQIERWLPGLPADSMCASVEPFAWRLRVGADELPVTEVRRVRGRPLLVVRRGGAVDDVSSTAIVFVDADASRLWFGVHVFGDTAAEAVSVENAAGRHVLGERPEGGPPTCYWSVDTDGVQHVGEDAFLAAASRAARRIGTRRARGLHVESDTPWLTALVEDAACDLLVQQHATTGRLWAVHDARPLDARDTAGAVLGLLRLGHWDEAARAIEAVAVGDPDERDGCWLTLASYWHARAAADPTLAARHWTRLSRWATTAVEVTNDDVAADERVLRAAVAQAMGSLHAIRAGSPHGGGTGAAPWFERWQAMHRWVDAPARLGEGTPFLAPSLGHFFGGALHDERIADDLRRHPVASAGDVDAELAARRLVALTHERHPDRGTAWTALAACARDGGDWGGTPARDPGRTGRAIEALMTGLMGARTTCWGPMPEQILSLDLAVPPGLGWWRATGVARDRWQVDVDVRRVARSLETAEREALAGHPEIGPRPEGEVLSLLECAVLLRSEPPPAGAWQASVGLGGTLFQRYLTREQPVREIELDPAPAAQRKPSATAAPASARSGARRGASTGS